MRGQGAGVTGAILSASAPNLDPIAFKEAALARLRNVAVSFESGAARSALAVALAACLSSSRMKSCAATLLPAQLPLSMCASDACGGALSSFFQSSQSLLSPFLLASRACFAAPGVLEACYSHFAPQPSLHPCRVRSRFRRLSILLAHPLVRALAHVPIRPSVHYLPLLCVLCRLPSHCVHARPSSHRLPHHFRGVLRVVISEVCCRYRVDVCVAGYSHVCWHPRAT